MTKWEWHALEDESAIEAAQVAGGTVRAGQQVKLRPRQGGDIMDLILEGKVATVESIEEDYEGKLHLAVVIDDDPGRDLGLLRQPGHRFFFDTSEVELYQQHDES